MFENSFFILCKYATSNGTMTCKKTDFAGGWHSVSGGCS
jgi:hypothetical protein